jgi:Carboxypeptidase regulatory-like domain
MNRIPTLLVPIIAYWMGTIPVIAQTTSGSISGTVTDASGAGIPGAQVTAINTQTGAQRASVTDGDGRYQLPGLPPGIYELRVEKEGFNTIIQQGIVLEVTQDAVLNVALRVGVLKQEFTVSAAPPLLI